MLSFAGYAGNLGRLLSYTSPLILLCAVSLFLLFVKCRFKNKGLRTVISVLAPASFGVYILHLHPFLWVNFFNDAFTSFGQLSLWKCIGAVILTVICIYLLGSFVDLLRIRMFALLHIPQLAIKIEQIFSKLSNKCFK